MKCAGVCLEKPVFDAELERSLGPHATKASGDDEAFFKTFDYAFRMRRLRYFIQCINRMFRELEEEQRAGQDDPVDQGAVLSRLKATLYGHLEEYADGVWKIWSAVRGNAAEYDQHPAELADFLVESFSELMEEGRREKEKEAIRQIPEIAQSIGLGGRYQWMRASSTDLFEVYEYFDMYLFPAVTLAGVGEADLLEVVRISPRDAGRHTTDVAAKLAGEKMAHFSAFLKESWRRNDILWGRLDAAELIAGKLLGMGKEAKDRFMAKVSPAIILEEAEDREDREKVARELGELGDVRYLREKYEVGKEGFDAISRPYAVEAVSRALRTLGRLMLRLPDKAPPKLAPAVERLTRSIERAFSMLSRILAVFGSASGPLGKHPGAVAGMGSFAVLALSVLDIIDIKGGALWGAVALVVGYWLFGRLWLLAGTAGFAALFAVKTGIVQMPGFLKSLGMLQMPDFLKSLHEQGELLDTFIAAVAAVSGLLVLLISLGKQAKRKFIQRSGR